VDEATDARLEDAVRSEVELWGEVRPPYVVSPGTDPFDIGWRMGAGEWHILVWSRWWSDPPRDEESRLAYFRRHPPPTEWLHWCATAVWPELDDEMDDEMDDDAGGPAVRRLADHGIGAYADWRAWCYGTSARPPQPPSERLAE
jgi:hypothetical protein